MTEPTSATGGVVAAITSAASATTLALLGVDYYAIIGALIGALAARSRMPRDDSRMQVMLGLLLSILVGAVMGAALVSMLGGAPRVVQMLACLVAASAWQFLLDKLVLRAAKFIDDSKPAGLGGK